MRKGDKVYIDPEKIKEKYPEKLGEYQDYFYKTYIVGFVLNNEYVTAKPIGIPVGENPYTQVILDSSMLSYVA